MVLIDGFADERGQGDGQRILTHGEIPREPWTAFFPGRGGGDRRRHPQERERQPSVFYLPGPRYKSAEPAGHETALC